MLHLHRGKVNREPESLSDAGSAGRKGRPYAMRVDYRARVTYAAATPAVQAHAYAVKKDAVRKVSGARKHPAAIADIATAIGELFARLAGSRDEHKATSRALGLRDAR